MNREIKFRAWNIPNKTMYENVQNGILAQNEKGQLILDVTLGKLLKDAGSVIMQYTGLKDRNGRNVYEGDILKNPKNKKGVVELFDGSFCLKSNGYFVLNSGFLKNKEVVGNIYENPELLNEIAD